LFILRTYYIKYQNIFNLKLINYLMLQIPTGKETIIIHKKKEITYDQFYKETYIKSLKYKKFKKNYVFVYSKK
jgi:hypothetical protein